MIIQGVQPWGKGENSDKERQEKASLSAKCCHPIREGDREGRARPSPAGHKEQHWEFWLNIREKKKNSHFPVAASRVWGSWDPQQDEHQKKEQPVLLLTLPKDLGFPHIPFSKFSPLDTDLRPHWALLSILSSQGSPGVTTFPFSQKVQKYIPILLLGTSGTGKQQQP